MLDDVANFFPVEPEVDGYGDTAMCRHGQELVLEPGRVVGDDGDAFAEADSHLIHPRRELSPFASDVGERQVRPRIGRLVRFIDDGNPVGIAEFGAVHEGLDGQRRTHVGLPSGADGSESTASFPVTLQR